MEWQWELTSLEQNSGSILFLFFLLRAKNKTLVKTELSFLSYFMFLSRKEKQTKKQKTNKDTVSDSWLWTLTRCWLWHLWIPTPFIWLQRGGFEWEFFIEIDKTGKRRWRVTVVKLLAFKLGGKNSNKDSRKLRTQGNSPGRQVELREGSVMEKTLSLHLVYFNFKSNSVLLQTIQTIKAEAQSCLTRCCAFTKNMLAQTLEVNSISMHFNSTLPKKTTVRTRISKCKRYKAKR